MLTLEGSKDGSEDFPNFFGIYHAKHYEKKTPESRRFPGKVMTFLALGELFRAFYIVTRCSKPLKTVIFDFHSVQNRGVLLSTFIYLVRQICGKIICHLTGKRENFAYIK